MSKLEIRLPNGSLDLSPDSQSKFYITKQIHDIRNLETRKANFSKSLIIPRTINNVILLGVELVEFGRDSINPYKFLECEVLLASYPVMSEGQLIVTSQNDRDKTITINILGGTVTLFEALSDNGLSSLPLTNYSFDWTLANIQNYVNTTEGLLFGQNSWFSNDNWLEALEKTIAPSIVLTDPDVNYNGAWFYVKTLMDKIFENMPQLEIDNTALEALDDYDKMVVMIPVTKLFDNFTSITGFSGLVEQEDGNAEFVGSFAPPVRAEFPNVLEDEPIGFWDSVESEYVVSASSFYDISLNLDIQAYGNTTIFGYAGITVYADTDVIYQTRVTTANVTISEVISVFVNAGTKIYVELSGELSNNTTGINWSGSFRCKGSGTIASDFVNISEYMPDISQKDFVKEVFKFFHAIPTFKDGVTTISLWDDIIDREQEDLTQYLDESNDIVEQGYLPNYGQKNRLEFTIDNTVDREGTDYTFPVKNQILPSEKVKIKSMFSPSDQAAPLDYVLCSTPLMPFDYERITNNDITVTSGTDTYSTVDSNDLKVGDLIFVLNAAGTGLQDRKRVISIQDNRNGKVDDNWAESSTGIWEQIQYSKQDIGLRFGQVTQLGTTTIRDGGLSVSVANAKGISFPEAYNWENLSNKYYLNLVEMLEKPVVKQAWFRLPPTVFNELDLLRPIYLKDRLYYLNKIEQYNYSGFCRMELIEIKVNESFIPLPFYIASPNPLDFGNVDASTVTNEKVNIINVGAESIEFNVNAITGAGASYFSFNPPIVNPITIGVGGVKEVYVDFTADTSFGSKEAQFQVEGLTEGLFDIDVALDGFIDSQADYTVEPSPIVLIPTPDGFQTVASTVVTNTGIGSIDFELSPITGSGEFEYNPGTPLSFTLLEGQQTGLSIRFNSTAPNGLKQASFVVEAVSPDIFDKTVQIFGQTVNNPATYSVSSNPLEFGDRNNNALPITQFTTVENTGTDTINFTLTTITGPNAIEFDFAVGQPTAFSLDPGQTEDIGITWDTANPKTFKQAFFTIEANHQFGVDTIVEVNGTTI